MVEAFAARGAYFSFNASFLAEQRHKKRETFLKIPLERLLIETDAPPCPPTRTKPLPPPTHPRRRPHKSPRQHRVAYEGLAKLRGIPMEKLKPIIEENFRRFFEKRRLATNIHRKAIY